MDVSKILSEIDAEIKRLQEARSALVTISGTTVTVTKRRGRPKGSTNAPKPTTKRTRKLSPEGRKRIAEAQKRRWAESRKKTSKADSSAK
jgi:transposase